MHSGFFTQPDWTRLPDWSRYPRAHRTQAVSRVSTPRLIQAAHAFADPRGYFVSWRMTTGKPHLSRPTHV